MIQNMNGLTNKLNKGLQSNSAARYHVERNGNRLTWNSIRDGNLMDILIGHTMRVELADNKMQNIRIAFGIALNVVTWWKYFLKIE